jgi:hypothetical protein
VKASIANSIERALAWVEQGELDYALASIDGLAEHLESISVRGKDAEGAEELSADQIVSIEEALREASMGILTHRLEHAQAELSGARKALQSGPITTTYSL